MKALALLAAGLVVSAPSATRPPVSFNPATAAPGDAITVRHPAIKGTLRAALRAPEGRRTTLRSVGPAAKGSFRATVANLAPGDYVVEVLRRGRVVASARRALRLREAPAAVRDCDSSIYGEFPEGWEQRTVWAGPLGLVGATSGTPPRPMRGNPDYFEPIKFVLVLENTHVATIRVAAGDRPHVALLYARRGGLGEFRSARVVDGLPAVRFEACPPSEVLHTQFNGGLVVDGPRCAELEVHVRGRPGPYPLRVPFGRAC
jgi:hypothetical protein